MRAGSPLVLLALGKRTYLRGGTRYPLGEGTRAEPGPGTPCKNAASHGAPVVMPIHK
jgi:uncharacterized protein (DUF39 family)